jgi:predicted GIY-YIG superfamily endonuclease
MFYVYLLVNSTKKNSYVGATVNIDKRLRQHNMEIKGGAIATTTKVKNGDKWERMCYVTGFPDWTSALQFEWKWKYLTRKIVINKAPLYRRLDALEELLNLEKSTTKAIPFSQWETQPEVHFENEDAKTYFRENKK